MATLTFISPKNMFSRIADIWQNREGYAPANTFKMKTPPSQSSPQTQTTSMLPKTKLNISLDDLKLISTALLQYRRSLAKIGEIEKAEEVARIDQQFYDLISNLETPTESLEDISQAAA